MPTTKGLSMMDVLSQATHNFVQHQLRLTSTEVDLSQEYDLYHSDISLLSSGQTQQASFYYTDDFMQMVCMAMLGEEAEDDETLEDLIGETTNQIAGSAKILATQAFDIGLPNYLGKVKEQPENGTYRAFSIDNKVMLYITLK